MKKIRVGFLGIGSIVRRVMADFHKGESYELTAVASRDIQRARAAAEKYGAKYAFGSYAELAACDEVDLVYIATPHPFHRAQTLDMLRAGKHVLCEKAFAMNAIEAAEMINLAREKRLFLMEAMWTRCLPAIIEIKARADAGDFGDIRLITADFGFASDFDARSRIYDPALGGGALLDVGVYAVSFASLLLGTAPRSINAICRKAQTGVDLDFAMQFAYDSGARAQLYCAVDTKTNWQATIYTSKGILNVPDFWHATEYEFIHGAERKTRRFAPEAEGHYHEFEHAARRILGGFTESDIMPLDETRDILAFMTDMRLSQGIIYPMEREYAQT